MGRSSVFYTLDGIWNEETGDLLTNTVTPPPEAIDQTKVLQNNYSVQYNMMGGAMFMVHTKSGTAQFHGQAWYFLRNGVFNALNYFYNSQQAALNTSTGAQTKSLNPPFRWNIGGLGLGGPLFIPHVYNTNRDKTFFYINGQYVKQVTYTVASATFPTADEINGIFPAEIHDPVTQNDYPVSPGGPAGNQWTIPQNKIVPQAQALLRAFVPPGIQSVPCTPSPGNQCDVMQRSTNDYQLTNPSLFKQLNVMGKIDHVINSRFRLTGEYFREGVRNQLPSASRMGSLSPYNWDIFYNNDSVAQVHLNEQIGSDDAQSDQCRHGSLYRDAHLRRHSSQLRCSRLFVATALSRNDHWTGWPVASADYLLERLDHLRNQLHRYAVAHGVPGRNPHRQLELVARKAQHCRRWNLPARPLPH